MMVLKLILAHLIGDFLFQPNIWVIDKEGKKYKSLYLYLHALVHFLLVFIFLGDVNLWWVAAIIGISHLIIDWAKLNFQTPKTRRSWFFIDQILHFLVILGIGYYFNEVNFNFLNQPYPLKIITALVFLSIPTSIAIKTLITYWTPETHNKEDLNSESLVNAGKYIGILERFLVLVFILVNHWEGVGFMITAKSVFRFSDLAQAKQRKLTEYVLIGTLLSFGIAILTGILVNL